MKPIRLIQVGMGGWGRNWNRLLANYPELAQTVAYVDVGAESLQQLQAEDGVAADVCFPSLADALERVEAEAVLVTTTVDYHVPVVQAALEAGKHVLVEKPFAPSLAAARQAVEAAAARERVLMVSQNYRFFPAVEAAARLLQQGTLGPVGSAQVDFRYYANTQAPGTNRHYLLKEPLLLDMSIHHFDLMRVVLGQEPVSVYCQTWNPPWSHFAEPPAGAATISFDGGTVVNYTGSWVSSGLPTLWGGTWQMEGAEGVLHWTSRDSDGPGSDRAMIRPRGGRPRWLPLPALDYTGRAGAMAAFVKAVREGTEPASSGRDNLRTLALALAAIESAATGRPQPIASISGPANGE